MKSRLAETLYAGVLLLIVILLFTLIDFFAHGLRVAWSVPDYYFRNKIPFGFLWGIVGLCLARKIENIWLKALVVAGVIAVTLQVRYFIEGYPLDFVVLFLFIHLVILYFLSVCMFIIRGRYELTSKKMKKTIIALVVLVVVALAVYFTVFSGGNQSTAVTPVTTSTTATQSSAGTSVQYSAQKPLSAPPVVSLKTVTVEIKNMSFVPASITVKRGTRVTWYNEATVQHTVTSDVAGRISSGPIDPGRSFTAAFESVGTVLYHCSIHPTMTAKVIVTD